MDLMKVSEHVDRMFPPLTHQKDLAQDSRRILGKRYWEMNCCGFLVSSALDNTDTAVGCTGDC